MRSIDELIAMLADPNVDTRFDAATRLRDMTPPPVAAVAALVARLDDTEPIEEQWTDWNGAIVGGTTHWVADRALEALVQIGTPAFTALVAAVESGGPVPMLHRLVAKVPMDALCAAGLDVITRARRFASVTTAPSGRMDDPLVNASYALAWAQDELSRSDDRIEVLGRRLDMLVGPTARLAAEELGTVAPSDATRAATLLAELLLREPHPGIFVETAAAASLDKLGPVLEASLSIRLIDATPTKLMFHCWPQLLPAVARYPGGERLGPWLLAWLRDKHPAMSIGTEHLAAVRNAAALAIVRMGNLARPLHDELAEIYAAGSAAARALVLRALPDRSVLVTRLAPRWRTTLVGENRQAIEDALEAIHGLGADAAPLLDAILPFVEGPRAAYKATLTIGQLGEAARPAVPALIRALETNQRTWACFSLRALGPDIAAEAIGPLEALAARLRTAGVRDTDVQQTLDKLRS